MYQANLKLRQTTDIHDYKLIDLSNQVNDQGKRLSETSSTITDIFSAMIKPYDTKIEAVDEKPTQQFKNSQEEVAETRAQLSNIMSKLETLSPPPSIAPSNHTRPTVVKLTSIKWLIG
ncbi:unnamed protein product [Ambrosiozyma monospora]|uniref:Unnamed protein product n=1 Tax=Ambrosiozyma monospora TaxID=43982 RepID=A0ACB5SZ95_AMBMO|nr:unnamed protein product [Ambrosiozyma monospora]